MTDSINFLRQRTRQLSKLQRQDRIWFNWAAVGCGVVVTATAVVTGINVFLRYQTNQLEDRQQVIERRISTQQSVEQSYAVYRQKLKTLAVIYGLRGDKQAAIQFFTELFDEEVLIREITYQAEDGLLSFGVQAPSVFGMQRVFSTLETAEVAQRYPELSKSELKRAADGSYQVMVTLSLESGGGGGRAAAAPTTPSTPNPTSTPPTPGDQP